MSGCHGYLFPWMYIYTVYKVHVVCECVFRKDHYGSCIIDDGCKYMFQNVYLFPNIKLQLRDE